MHCMERLLWVTMAKTIPRVGDPSFSVCSALFLVIHMKILPPPTRYFPAGGFYRGITQLLDMFKSFVSPWPNDICYRRTLKARLHPPPSPHLLGASPLFQGTNSFLPRYVFFNTVLGIGSALEHRVYSCEMVFSFPWLFKPPVSNGGNYIRVPLVKETQTHI